MLLWMAHLFIKQVMARAGANVLIQELAKEVTDLLLVIADVNSRPFPETYITCVS